MWHAPLQASFKEAHYPALSSVPCVKVQPGQEFKRQAAPPPYTLPVVQTQCGSLLDNGSALASLSFPGTEMSRTSGFISLEGEGKKEKQPLRPTPISKEPVPQSKRAGGSS